MWNWTWNMMSLKWLATLRLQRKKFPMATLQIVESIWWMGSYRDLSCYIGLTNSPPIVLRLYAAESFLQVLSFFSGCDILHRFFLIPHLIEVQIFHWVPKQKMVLWFRSIKTVSKFQLFEVASIFHVSQNSFPSPDNFSYWVIRQDENRTRL